MTGLTVEQALENIYASLAHDNDDIDNHIAGLREALARQGGGKTVSVKAGRLPQNNRQGRKMMQSYFKKRGVDVTFEA